MTMDDRDVQKTFTAALGETLKMAGEGRMSVIKEIAAERERQKTVEGWTPEHDDRHDEGQLAKAAGCYALASTFGRDTAYSAVLSIWPWSRAWLKPKTPRHDLIRAAALIVAEIERLDRAALAEPPQGGE